MNKKISVILSLCLLSVLLFVGCTPATITPSLTPKTTPLTTPMVSPMVSPQISPMVSAMPSPMTSPLTSPMVGAGTANLEMSKKVETEVGKLSEIGKTSALIVGTKAIVGVEFGTTYKGAMTDRIMEMIVAKAKEVDTTLTDVVVTDDPAIYKEIVDLRTKLDTGTAPETLQADFDKIMAKIKPAA